MDWFRWFTGTLSDPKFQWISVKSGHSTAVVLAVWVAVLERANGHEVRGCCDGMDFEALDVVLGLDDGVTEEIYGMMERRHLITDGMVTAWAKRQPKREDDGATERQRDKRERDRLRKENEELRACLSQQQDVTLRDVTHCHAMSRNVTTEERREEEKREEIKPKTSTAAASSQASTTPTPSPPVEQQQQPENVVTVFADSPQRIRGAFKERQQFLKEQFPHLNLAVEEEQCVAKYQGRPIGVDAAVLVLEWCKRVSVGKPDARSRDRPSKSKAQEREDATIEAGREALRLMRAAREANDDQGRSGDAGDYPAGGGAGFPAYPAADCGVLRGVG